VSTISITTHISKPHASVHHIKTLHFATQTCQNCVLMQMSTISNDYTSFQDHMPVSTISNTTHFLYKHVKIASISKCPLYQSLHIFQNHMPVSTISNTTHFLYKHVKFAVSTVSKPRCVHQFNTTLSLLK
jgi:hypothetical protein